MTSGSTMTRGRARGGATASTSKFMMSGAVAAGSATKAAHGRPPVLIELSARYIRAGYVGQASAPHLVPCSLPSSPLEPVPSPQSPAAEWYRYYSPLFHDALTYVLEATAATFSPGAPLGTGASSTSFLSSSSVSAANDGRRNRRVVLVYHGMPGGMSRNQREALEVLLLRELGFPALSIQPAMVLSFFALGRPHGIVVYASSVARAPANRVSDSSNSSTMAMMIEGHCMAISHHQPLEFTYQATGCPHFDGARGSPGSGDQMDEDYDDADTLQRNWDRNWKRHLLDPSSPHSLARCIVQCLRACPRDVQALAVSNLFFCGDVFATNEANLQRGVALQVREALSGGVAGTSSTSYPPSADPSEEVPQSAPITTADDRSGAHCYTYRNGASHRLSSPLLRDSVGVVRVPGLRCEVLPWVGPSLWASHWHSVHPEAPAFQWKTTSSSAFQKAAADDATATRTAAASTAAAAVLTTKARVQTAAAPAQL